MPELARSWVASVYWEVFHFGEDEVFWAWMDRQYRVSMLKSTEQNAMLLIIVTEVVHILPEELKVK